MILFTVIATVAISISGVICVTTSRNALKTRLQEQLKGFASVKTYSLQTFVKEKTDNLVRITKEESVTNAIQNTAKILPEKEKNDVRIYFGEYISKDNFIELFLLDTNGTIVISTDPLQEGKIQADEIYFLNGKKAVSADKFRYVTNLEQPSMIISAPLKNTEGNVVAVLSGRISLEKISELMLERTGLGDTGETILIDKTHLLITESRSIKNSIFKKYIYTEGTKACIDGKNGLAEYYDYRGIPVLAWYEWIPEREVCLQAKIDQQEAYKPINDLIRLTIGTLVVVLLLLFVLSYIFALTITYPIQKLLTGALEIAKGNFSYKVPSIGNDEFGKLGTAFNVMGETLKNSYANLEEKIQEKTKELQEKNTSLEGGQKAILNILEDVEVEKKKVEMIAEDLEKFKLAVENASDHIVITDAEGIILYANKAVETITGFTRDEVLGKKAGGKILWGGSMDIPFYTLLWKTIKSNKKVFTGEVKNYRKNGETYIAAASISPIVDKNGVVKFFIGIERDITRIKEIDRMKTEFISLASHQLRTPLSAMKWFSEMLLAGDAGALTDEQKEFVTNISQSNERMIELVNSLLNISRIESGRLIIDPHPTDMGVLIKDLLKELQSQIDEKNLHITLSIEDALPLVNADSKLLRQVYQNLLTNAIKYTPKEGAIQISLSIKDEYLLSQVSDTGFGIPKEEQSHIFERFFRAKNIMKLETEGTGLGLYLIKAIVESSHGTIWFTSQEDKGLPAGRHGSTFWFTIPLSGMAPKKGDVGLEENNIMT